MISGLDIKNLIARLYDFGNYRGIISINAKDNDSTTKKISLTLETTMNQKDFIKFKQFTDAINQADPGTKNCNLIDKSFNNEY